MQGTPPEARSGQGRTRDQIVEKPVTVARPGEIDPVAREIYCRAVETLGNAAVPFLVGGSYALERYTAIARHTKDFDVFVHRRDLDRVFELLSR